MVTAVVEAQAMAIANGLIKDEINIELGDKYKVVDLADRRLVLVNKTDDNEVLFTVRGVITHAEFPHEDNLELLLKVSKYIYCDRINMNDTQKKDGPKVRQALQLFSRTPEYVKNMQKLKDVRSHFEHHLGENEIQLKTDRTTTFFFAATPILYTRRGDSDVACTPPVHVDTKGAIQRFTRERPRMIYTEDNNVQYAELVDYAR